MTLLRHTITERELDEPMCAYCGYPFDAGDQVWIRDELEMFCSVMCCTKRHPPEDDPPDREPELPEESHHDREVQSGADQSG